MLRSIVRILNEDVARPSIGHNDLQHQEVRNIPRPHPHLDLHPDGRRIDVSELHHPYNDLGPSRASAEEVVRGRYADDCPDDSREQRQSEVGRHEVSPTDPLTGMGTIVHHDGVQAPIWFDEGGRRHDHRQSLPSAVRLVAWGRTPSLAFFVGQAPPPHIDDLDATPPVTGPPSTGRARYRSLTTRSRSSQ